MSTAPSRRSPRLPAKPAHPVALAASVCGLGYLPVAPGTWGSLAGLPIAYVLASQPPVVAVLALFALTAVGVWVASRAEALFATHDAAYIVLDEVVGMAISLGGLPVSWPLYIAGFVLFRLFDALKPGPIGWLDRRVPGGLGVVIDDVAAGLATLATLWLARTAWAAGGL